MLPSSLRFLRVVFFGVLSSLAALAQYSGNIQGVVTDPSDAAVANASIRLHNLDNGIQASTTTSSSGNYRFSSLEPGHYAVTVTMPGFATEALNLTLGTSETQGINVKLTLASATEAVSVTAEAPVLDTDETRLQEENSAIFRPPILRHWQENSKVISSGAAANDYGSRPPNWEEAISANAVPATLESLT